MHFTLKIWVYGILIVFLASCQNENPSEISTDAIFQISTLDALLHGDYSGRLSFSELGMYGDFGVGTFEAVNGELIILDGIAYRATVDGLVSEAAPEDETPFAVVKHFNIDQEQSIENVESLEALGELIDPLLSSNENPYAILVDATFDSLIIRSVPEQMTPYPPLADVVAIQTVFNHGQISGSLVGFKFPEYAGSINVAGYHFHFISEDRSVGGHVLESKLMNGRLYIDESSDLIVTLAR